MLESSREYTQKVADIDCMCVGWYYTVNLCE